MRWTKRQTPSDTRRSCHVRRSDTYEQDAAETLGGCVFSTRVRFECESETGRVIGHTGTGGGVVGVCQVRGCQVAFRWKRNVARGYTVWGERFVDGRGLHETPFGDLIAICWWRQHRPMHLITGSYSIKYRAHWGCSTQFNRFRFHCLTYIPILWKGNLNTPSIL